jgi:ATP/maltotriose-dependent transcriptional regulator MalT
MDAPAVPPVDRSQLTGVEKLLHDVDVAIQGPLHDLPLSKQWQRALVTRLEEASRCLQVLRLTRAMGRPAAEVAEAAQKLSGAMRAVHAYVLPSRADMGTKATIHIGFGLAQRLAAELATPVR